MHYPVPNKKTFAIILIIFAFAVAIVASAIVCAEASMESAEGSIVPSIEVGSYHDNAKSEAKIESGSTNASTTPVAVRFELLGEDEIEWSCGRFFEDPGFIAEDSKGNDLSHLVTANGSLNLWRPGEYDIVYTLTDEEGNTSELTRTVILSSAELPETTATEKTVYLTFDDGPCMYTERVLDILDKYGAKATFFVVAGVNPYFELVNEILARGHSIGIHSASHEYGTIYASEEAFFNDFLSVQQKLYQYTGQYATVSRFPGGSVTAWAYCNAHVDGGFEVIEQGLANMGVRYYDWNIQTESPDNNPGDSINRFIYNTPQFEIPISLQHDTALFSVNALEGILSWCVENGYSFGTIDNTTPEVHSEPHF